MDVPSLLTMSVYPIGQRSIHDPSGPTLFPSLHLVHEPSFSQDTQKPKHVNVGSSNSADSVTIDVIPSSPVTSTIIFFPAGLPLFSIPYI